MDKPHDELKHFPLWLSAAQVFHLFPALTLAARYHIGLTGIDIYLTMPNMFNSYYFRN